MKKNLKNIVLGTLLALGVQGCGTEALESIPNRETKPEPRVCSFEDTSNCREGYSLEVSCGYNNSGKKTLTCIDGSMTEGECAGEDISSACQEGDRKIEYRTRSCEPLNSGFFVEEREQYCIDGQWQEFSDDEGWYVTASCPDISETPLDCPTLTDYECPLPPECPESETPATTGCPERIPLECPVIEPYECPVMECPVVNEPECPSVECPPALVCPSVEPFECPPAPDVPECPTVECPEVQECPSYECEPGMTLVDYRVVSCGLNGQGQSIEERTRECLSGTFRDWSEWNIAYSCLDPDDCVDASTNIEVCGINNTGQQRQLCIDGEFVNDGSCLDDDLCLNSTDYGTISCGAEESGERSVVCEEGNLVFGECEGEIEAICTGLAGEILFSDATNIYKVNASTLEITNLTNSFNDGNFQPKWSLDKSKIAFVSHEGYTPGGWLNLEVYVMNADGSNLTNISNNPGDEDYYPTWHPDGTKIAFYSRANFRGTGIDGIFIADLNTGEVTYSGVRSIYELEWSRDGRKITFAEHFWNPDGTPNWEIYSGDGNFSWSSMVRLTNVTSGNDTDPSFSPDGRKILFVSDREGNKEIYVMNADGTNQINLSNDPLAQDFNPVWSAGGSKILFTKSGGYIDLGHGPTRECSAYVMNSDGTNITRLWLGRSPYCDSIGVGSGEYFWGGIDWEE